MVYSIDKDTQRKKRRHGFSSESEEVTDDALHDSDFLPGASEDEDIGEEEVEQHDDDSRTTPVSHQRKKGKLLALETSSPEFGIHDVSKHTGSTSILIPDTPDAHRPIHPSTRKDSPPSLSMLYKSHSKIETSHRDGTLGKLGSLKNPRFQSHVSSRTISVNRSSLSVGPKTSSSLTSLNVSASLKSQLSFYEYKNGSRETPPFRIPDELEDNDDDDDEILLKPRPTLSKLSMTNSNGVSVSSRRKKNAILESPDVSPVKSSTGMSSTFPAAQHESSALYSTAQMLQVKDVFPEMDETLIHDALAKKRGNVTDAVEWLMSTTGQDDDDDDILSGVPRPKLIPMVESFLSGSDKNKPTKQKVAKPSGVIDLTEENESSPIQVTKRKGLKKKAHQVVENALPNASRDSSPTVVDVSSSPVQKFQSVSSSPVKEEPRGMTSVEQKALAFFNGGSEVALTTILSCSSEQAAQIMKSRPFESVDDLEAKFASLGMTRTSSNSKKSSGNSKGGSSGQISSRSMMSLWNRHLAVLEGYEDIDELIDHCEQLGRELDSITTMWTTSQNTGQPLSQKDSDPLFLSKQPAFVNSELQLKSYQLFGVSWLYLLYSKNLGGILADEMGLGKTAQVISFLALLLEKGDEGPHLIIVPASTLENWKRELKRWCPALVVQAYHGSMAERREIQDAILHDEEHFHVLLTTYNLATGSKEDRSFLKKCQCKTLILDEGHMIKNMASARHKHLMAIKCDFRLLLTGTPLQNNLMELIALLMFIMPSTFTPGKDALERIFQAKHAFDPENNEKDGNKTDPDLDLPRQRIERAKVIMNPFVLRRKKNIVLKDLPQKIRQVLRCSQTTRQIELYQNTLIESRKDWMSSTNTKNGNMATRNSKAVLSLLMQLRKIANHPLLIRSLYDMPTIKKMATCLMRDPEYVDANKDYLIEDMSFLSDFELHSLCLKFPRTIGKFQLESETWMDGGKVKFLSQLLQEYHEANEIIFQSGDTHTLPNRVLIFSQFVIVLDILESVLNTMGIQFVRLDGGTPVSERQVIIDQFVDNPKTMVFLLTTRSGGVGINLACANIVIMYDLDFNPHNDAQAEDRAYRLGQTRDVKVIKLITEGSVEEHIYSCAESKLKLDEELQRDSTNQDDSNSLNIDEDDADNLDDISKENIHESPMKALHLKGARGVSSPAKMKRKSGDDVIDLETDGPATQSKRCDIQDKVIDLFWVDLMNNNT